MPSACPRCGRAVPPSAGRCPHCAAPSSDQPRGGGSRVQLATPRPADLTPAKPPPPAPTTAQRAAEGLVEGTRTGVKVGSRLFRRLSRRAKIILVAVVVALVVGVPATLWAVGKVAYSPEEPVEDLAAAFNDGDVARAAALAGCASKLCGGGDGYEAPGGMKIVNVAMGGSTSPDTADIRIGYTLAGQPQQSVIRVERGSGLTPSDWRIVSGVTSSLEVVAPGMTAVTVGGVELAVPSGGDRTARTQVLMGSYTVRATPGNKLYDASEVAAAITGDLRNRGVTSVTLTPTVRPAILDAATRQIRDFLDGCAHSPDYEPEVDGRKCPFAHKWPVPDRSTPALWTIEPPEFQLAPKDLPTKDAQLEVRTTKPGKATINYTSRGKPETYKYEVTVGGTVTVGDNDSITWTE
jgi:hypothetical protein